ncbi:hypothetical protein PRIPAC_82424 [Pristionchus pacificus]|uniref:Uncharacterized protein n=1 Tax=Pristionchus pacificus TaxID=54126 RepID=A0A2A6BHY6_PRIPA|nr:hypothetical protein PRIPAC_82424 [Pristionchus pacificus]|eukprot:PDM65421.1 hypothetical protein PRIPAC_52363 [Pristionchus pacificus]
MVDGLCRVTLLTSRLIRTLRLRWMWNGETTTAPSEREQPKLRTAAVAAAFPIHTCSSCRASGQMASVVQAVQRHFSLLIDSNRREGGVVASQPIVALQRELQRPANHRCYGAPHHSFDLTDYYSHCRVGHNRLSECNV